MAGKLGVAPSPKRICKSIQIVSCMVYYKCLLPKLKLVRLRHGLWVDYSIDLHKHAEKISWPSYNLGHFDSGLIVAAALYEFLPFRESFCSKGA